MKKLLSVVLSVLLLVGIMAFPASAAEGTPVRLCSTGSCQNAVSILQGYGCQQPAAALDLYSNTTEYHSLTDVLRKFGCSEDCSEKIVCALRFCGYQVDVIHEDGVCVSPDPSCSQEQSDSSCAQPQSETPQVVAPSEAVAETLPELPPATPTVQPTPTVEPTQETEKPVETQQSQTEPAEPQQEQYAPNEYEREVVRLVNENRALYNLPALQLNAELCRVARFKALDMRQNRYFDHTSPTYGSPFDMMKSFGISYRTAGENIAMGYRTPQQVVDGWMNSSGHRANILNPSFSQIGVGYVEDGHYWSQMFIG